MRLAQIIPVNTSSTLHMMTSTLSSTQRMRLCHQRFKRGVEWNLQVKSIEVPYEMMYFSRMRLVTQALDSCH
jgi:hypothetical protein